MSEPTPEQRAAVEAIHLRYLLEVVEGMNLCPFARKSREMGRVHRPLFFVDENVAPEPYAQHLFTLLEEHPDAEIVLLTFVVPLAHRWARTEGFDVFVRALRDAWEKLDGPRFYMVGFHPGNVLEGSTPLTPDTLVSLIRRTPDPVVQCVNAAVLDRVREQSRAQAKERFVKSLQVDFPDLDPAVRQMLERSVQTESELSRDIAKRNFETVGEGNGREHFEEVIRDILNARSKVRDEHGI